MICFFEILPGPTPSLAITAYASSGVSDRTGNSYDLLGLVLQYRWLGGAR